MSIIIITLIMTCMHLHLFPAQTGSPLVTFQLCGDNIDKTINQRYMRTDHARPDSIHYFHYYAVADRIDFSGLSDQVIPTLQQDSAKIAVSLLPTDEDDLAIWDNICVLLSRILYENMEFFKVSFDGVIDWHIKHEFSDEMSTKSVIVSK